MKQQNNHDARIAKLVRERDKELNKYYGYDCQEWLACFNKYDGLIASVQLEKRRSEEAKKLKIRAKKKNYYLNSSQKTILQ